MLCTDVSTPGGEQELAPTEGEDASRDRTRTLAAAENAQVGRHQSAQPSQRIGIEELQDRKIRPTRLNPADLEILPSRRHRRERSHEGGLAAQISAVQNDSPSRLAQGRM
jgi:hypothetical protein